MLKIEDILTFIKVETALRKRSCTQNLEQLIIIAKLVENCQYFVSQDGDVRITHKRVIVASIAASISRFSNFTLENAKCISAADAMLKFAEKQVADIKTDIVFER